MGALNISATQYRLPLQNIQDRYVRLELLNYKYQTVDRIEGVCTGGSIAINANSDVRRTGSVTLVVTDSSFQVGADTKIWLDKYRSKVNGTWANGKAGAAISPLGEGRRPPGGLRIWHKPECQTYYSAGRKKQTGRR